MQQLFPQATQYKNTSSAFIPFTSSIKIASFKVEKKMVTTFTSRSERSYIDLKALRDANLQKFTSEAIAEMAEKFPDYSCFVVLGQVEIPFHADEHTTLNTFRFNVNRNDTTRKIFISVQTQHESKNILAQRKQGLIPTKEHISSVSTPDEEEAFEAEFTRVPLRRRTAKPESEPEELRI